MQTAMLSPGTSTSIAPRSALADQPCSDQPCQAEPPTAIIASGVGSIEEGRDMASERERTNLIEVKLALAKKYESLARQASGKPKQKKFLYDAGRYRRAAQMLMAGKS
jgi:hypothetical protein